MKNMQKNYINKIYNIIKTIIKEDLEKNLMKKQYVLIDGRDNAIIGNYNTDLPDDAIYDANSMAEADPNGVYIVCKTYNNRYDINKDCVYKTNNESKKYIQEYIKENINYLIETTLKK